MAVKKKTVYLKGLGDLYINAERKDDPALTVDTAESDTLWSGVGGTTVALSQVQVLEGTYSLAVSGVNASGDGAALTPASPADYSDNEDKLMLVNVYSECAGDIKVRVYDGVNYEEFEYTVEANKWERVLVDLANPSDTSGTVDWSQVSKIEVLSDAVCDFYIDGIYFFDGLNDVERTEKVRIGCINELTLDRSDETAELRCSDNSVVESEITSTTITLTATVRDFDPAGLALITGGEVTTDSVTKQVTETTTVPASPGPYTYTLAEAANLKYGDGFGLWVFKTASGQLLQESPDSTIIPQGYYAIDPVTGVVTFNAADAEVPMTIVYNVVIGNGRTLEVKSDADFIEFSLQFKVKASNQKNVLFMFPRLKVSTSSIAPALDDYWQWEMEATVLASDTTGNYYEMHVEE